MSPVLFEMDPPEGGDVPWNERMETTQRDFRRALARARVVVDDPQILDDLHAITQEIPATTGYLMELEAEARHVTTAVPSSADDVLNHLRGIKDELEIIEAVANRLFSSVSSAS